MVKKFYYVTILLAIVFNSISTVKAQSWFGTAGWAYRKAITIDFTKVGAGPHINFPVLINITDPNLKTNALSNGNDILFTSSDGTFKLNHEIESYTSTSGTLVAWVTIPTLSSSANTVIYMYYGNTGASSQQNVVGTWDATFKGVYHMNGVTGTTIADATGVNNGTNYGTVPATGKISNARGFVTDSIKIAGMMGAPLSLTLSAWVYKTGGGQGEVISMGDKAAIRATAPGIRGIFYKSPGSWFGPTTSINIDGAWHYIATTFTSGGSSQKIYIDGMEVCSTTDAAPIYYTGLGPNTFIGKHGNINTSSNFDGTLDEVRVSATARAAGWLLTEYNNQNSPSTFYSIGVQNCGPTIVSAGPAIPAICQNTTTVALGGSFGTGAASALWTDGAAGGTFTNNGGGTPGTTTYKSSATASGTITLTLTTGGGCINTTSKPLTITPTPKITVFADYCIIQPNIRLLATSDIAVNATSWLWNNSIAGTNTATTSYLDIDIVGNYFVTANGCQPPTSLVISNELVVNGNFQGGQAGFITPFLGSNQYKYLADNPAITNELGPEGYYGIGPDANTYHGSFWGHDHTTGSGNFMIINGFPGAQPIVWQETVTVIPNTTYYFSAWGLSLNAAGNDAQLQFDVNGVLVGTNPPLPAGVDNNTNNGWSRFYGTWVSGAGVTSAIISITDLQTATGGNDFGLDDISFGTLTTFPVLTSAAGTDQQRLCAGNTIIPITYKISITNNEPVIAGLPAGLTTTWDGQTSTISGSSTAAGVYNYSITPCNQKTSTGTITIDAATVSGSLPAIISTCYNTTGTITLAGTVGNVTNWANSVDGGATWVNIANTTTTLSVLNVTKAVLYKAVVSKSYCNTVTSTVVKLGVRNLWTGENGTDWNNTLNWSDESLPTISLCNNVLIPVVAPPKVYPVLSTGIRAINDLTISANASLTVNGNAILQIAGTINNAGTFNVSAGTIEMKGSIMQTIAAATFVRDSIKSLIINNTVGVALGGTLILTDSLKVLKGVLFTNDNLILKSDSTSTARIASMPVDARGAATSYINGKVTIERYIPSHRAWRLLSTPLTATGAPTIQNAWQDSTSSKTLVSIINTHPGYGMPITGGTIANGFDTAFSNFNPTIKYYNGATNKLIGIPTTIMPINTYPGYFVFVRGSRSSRLLIPGGDTATKTVLRMKGNVITGDTVIIIPANCKYTLVGNPYPSAINFNSVSKNNINNKFYVWDPKLAGVYGVGGYVTLIENTLTSSYDIAPTDKALSPVSGNIASGEAFFVESVNPLIPGSLTFKETDKTTGGSDKVFRPVTGNEQQRVNLFGFYGDGTDYVADGVLTTYNVDNANTVDNNDAIKWSNSGENVGIARDGQNLVIERRHTIDGTDTTFLNLTNLWQPKYKLQVTTDAMENSGLSAVLKDTYSETINNAPLNLGGVTDIIFNVNADPASYAANRFSIVFGKQAMVLPVTFLSVAASPRQKDIVVHWLTADELNIKEYTVETSLTGSNFTKLATVTATANNAGGASYTWVDANAAAGLHYYRIKSTEISGKENYSIIVKAGMGNAIGGMAVSPNPVTGNTIHLQLNNMAAGKYQARLIAANGQVLLNKEINHAGGDATENIPLTKYITKGMYRLDITKPDGSKATISVAVE